MDEIKNYFPTGLEITCPERWAEALNYARETRDETLMHCITRLMRWVVREPGVKVVIGSDFEKYSFTFSQCYPDGHCGICGGIIYHGQPAIITRWADGTINEIKYGWHIHT